MVSSNQMEVGTLSVSSGFKISIEEMNVLFLLSFSLRIESTLILDL